MSTLYFHASSGTHIRDGVPFELDGVQYPANWLNLSTPKEKAALGLAEVITVGERKDDRYYWVSEKLEGETLTYTNTPKDLVMLKDEAKARAKKICHSLLSATDWMIIRKAERNIEIPAEVSAYRVSVVKAENDFETAYNAASTVDELIAVNVEWPEENFAIRKKDSGKR
jgi:hypothetical protein